MNRANSRIGFVVTSALIGVTMTQPALAQSKRFDIPAQPVQSAISALGDQADIQIVAARRNTKGKSANAVHGDMNVEQALSILLKGTGLTAHRTGPLTYMVVFLRKSSRAISAGEGRLTAAIPVSSANVETDPEDDGQGGDIIVTAEKRGQSLQKVAAAVTVLDGSDLIKRGATDITQVGSLTASLQISPIRTQSLIFLRGVGQTLTTPNADPSVAVNINGVYVPNEMSGTSFYDIDRIEVVPGPQGTLYGRNATGGVINLVTRRPGSSPAAEGFIEYGNYNRLHSFSAVDIPITDAFAIRGAVNYLRHDGFYDQGGNDQDSISTRLTAVYKPTDGTTVTAIGSYSHDGGIGNINQNAPPPAGGAWQLSFSPRDLGFNLDIKTYQASLEIDQKLTAALDLTYLGAYNYMNLFQKGTPWAGPPVAPLININRTEATSHELRLNGSWSRLEGILGLYYFHIRSPYASSLQLFPTLNIAQDSVPVSEGEAIFGQLTYSLLDTLRVTGGLRYSETTKKLVGQSTTTTVTIAEIDYNGRVRNRRLDWKVGAEIDVAPGTLGYATVATGFTPGGISDAQAVAGSRPAATFAPVKLQAYTAGIKSRIVRGVTLNAEGFYYDYNDYQVSARNLAGVNQVFNAAKAEIYGAQIDARISPTLRDSVTFSIGYLHAKAITLRTPLGNFDGFTLPYSPRWTVNTTYSHRFDLSNGGSFEPSVNFQYSSGRWAFYTHSPQSFIPENTRTDIDLTYHAPGGHWSIAGWVRNLENSVVETAGVPVALPGPAAFALAAPRTYGGRLSFNF